MLFKWTCILLITQCVCIFETYTYALVLYVCGYMYMYI